MDEKTSSQKEEIKETMVELKPEEKNLKKVNKGLAKKLIAYCRKKSPWIIHLSSGGCNGCSIEIVACLTPKYDIERFGMISKELPRHADILLIEGPMTTKLKQRVLDIYHQTPNPKVVVAVGSCPLSNGVYQGCYNVNGPLDKFIPVDVYIPGCPPKPEALIHGIVQALAKFDEVA